MPRPDRFEWVFFDVGETLLRVIAFEVSFAELLAEQGHAAPDGGLAAIVRRARRESLTEDHYEPGPDYAISAERARARRERFVDGVLRQLDLGDDERERCRVGIWESFVGPRCFGLYPDAPDTLRALGERGYRLGIISNWEPRLEILCRNHGLAERFEFILASEAEGYAKPGPHLFRRALELAGCPPERAIHVGDSYEHDVVGAGALGIRPVLLDRGDYYPPGTWQPTIRSLAELPELLESLEGGS